MKLFGLLVGVIKTFEFLVRGGVFSTFPYGVFREVCILSCVLCLIVFVY